ncbi:sodium-coupled monocarboxylate transporter 1-like [Mytilus californianus]|uniref:sodium-coupled monocarboxylate transporter 1-like n=1 Tax=Mytilus californianus TaxID=6549 RepID=UPI0022470533|nr:sodium-coupled monocarboxylate transporter 1-like [Mytilus californianus]
MAATFTALDYCLFGAVLIVSGLIGVYYLLKEKWGAKEASSDDILMGGREMPVFPVAMSLVASYMSAITVLGTPTEMYVFGSQYYLVGFSGLLTYPATCYVFLPFFHNLGLTSAYQYLELRFCRATRYLAGGIFALEMLLYMAVVLYAPALALNQVTGLSLWGSILSVGIVVTFYTSMGGLRAVLWTDTFQTFIVVGGLIGIISIGSSKLGGLAEVWRIASEGNRIEFFNFDPSPFVRCTFWGLIVGSFIGQLTIYGANQTMLQRYMSISNVRSSQLALFISLPATMLLITLVCLSGLVIYAAYATCDPLLDGKILARDQLLPYFVMETLGTINGIPGLFVACIFSAALSSISSCLNALSITVLEDLIKPTLDYCDVTMSQRSEARLAKLLGVLGGLLVIGLAFLCYFLGTTVLQIMITVLGMAGGPLLALFIMGMFMPCVNAVGATVGTIIGSIVIFWIVAGAFVYQAPLPELPFRTDGCDVKDQINDLFNQFTSHVVDFSATSKPDIVTELVTDHSVDWSGYKIIYQLSFLWYPTVAVCISIVFGILISWATGWRKGKINSRYIYPVSEKLCCCLPAFFLRCFNCNQLWKYNQQSGSDLLSDEEDEDDIPITIYTKTKIDGRNSQEAELTQPDIAIPKISQAEIDNNCSRLVAEHEQSSERSASPIHYYKIFWNDS